MLGAVSRVVYPKAALLMRLRERPRFALQVIVIIILFVRVLVHPRFRSRMTLPWIPYLLHFPTYPNPVLRLPMTTFQTAQVELPSRVRRVLALSLLRYYRFHSYILHHRVRPLLSTMLRHPCSSSPTFSSRFSLFPGVREAE